MSLQILGDSDKRVVGLKQVQRFARLGKLEKIFIAKDADEHIIEKLLALCGKHSIPYEKAYTMHQLGNACRIEVGSACAGILKSAE
ncbi:MAG: L7Ae/L30e/S12e/Gadd45 family ribosomal protein [Burkholderiales bacterium]